MNKQNKSASGGIGFCGMLTLLLIALKLIGVIGWPWWLVLAPMWVPTLTLILIIVIYILWRRR